MAISNVPWFATTVEGPFGVGAVGIFATIVRVVQAFVWVWMIILVKIKFILPEQTGSQYSHQYNIIIYYIRVPKGFGAPSLGRTQKSGAPGLRTKINRAPGLPRNWSRVPCSAMLFALIQKQILELRKYSYFYFLNAVFISFSRLYSCFTVIYSYLLIMINGCVLYKVQIPLVLRGSSTLSFHGFWYWERQCSITRNYGVWHCLCC